MVAMLPPRICFGQNSHNNSGFLKPDYHVYVWGNIQIGLVGKREDLPVCTTYDMHFFLYGGYYVGGMCCFCGER